VCSDDGVTYADPTIEIRRFGQHSRNLRRRGGAAGRPTVAAHADAHLIGATAKYIDCGLPINDGPTHIVAKAALHALTTWMTSATPRSPPAS
jgi:hypothetical protein